MKPGYVTCHVQNIAEKDHCSSNPGWSLGSKFRYPLGESLFVSRCQRSSLQRVFGELTFTNLALFSNPALQMQYFQ